MTIKKGYDGSKHAPTSLIASKVKRRGHKKEDVYAARIGGKVIKGRQKPDVIKEFERTSVKGAATNIQLLLISGKNELKKCIEVYGINNPIYKFQLAGAEHRKFKFENDDYIDEDLLDKFRNAANDAAEWLRNKNNFRIVIEKVFSDNYDANKLAVLKEVDQDAILYDMKDVVDLYVNSDYKIHVTDSAKIVVRADNREIFYLEIRGGKDHCGSMNHGVRTSGLYDFLKENLNYEIIPA